MSLKSFDEFCESDKIRETDSQKEIFDERQNVIRSRLAIEMLIVCLSICLINAWVMDWAYKWGSYTFSMMLIISISATYYFIRCAAKGCLFGVSGFRPRKKVLVITDIFCALNTLIRISNTANDGYIIKNGMLTDNFLSAVSFAILTICGIIMICGIIVYEKSFVKEKQK